MGGFRKRWERPEREDAEQFSRLYHETSHDLLAFLLRRCSTAEEAADCLAETYRIAWEKRNRLPARDEARPWLFGIARNVSRRERTRAERATETSRELAIAAEGSAPLATQADSEVIAALAELSPLDREIITLLSWDGLAPREVASVLGLSANAVRIRAHRARARLRVLLAADDGEEDPDAFDASASVASRGG
jgi:RNA polymerase sigma-70 factor (ECF subfamily)